jgi:hypothetical protein
VAGGFYRVASARVVFLTRLFSFSYFLSLVPMNNLANTPDASAEALAANFKVTELETRLENIWGEVPVNPTLPGSGDDNGGNG